MRAQRLAWAGAIGLILLAVLPAAGATPAVHGTVTTCASTTTCHFTFNTSAGSGWANTTSTQISFQLPGEPLVSHNLSYSTYIARLTGTYTYWTVGNFLGTDVNSGKVVYGTTNTNFTITCVGHSGRGGGCTYVYTTDNGTIVFHLTKAEQTSVTVACSPSSVSAGSSSKCTAQVKDLWNSSNVPNGTIRLLSPGTGTFSNKGVCTLAAGTCSLSWRAGDNTVGTVTISAIYAGSPVFYKSSGTTTVSVSGGG
jgi:hypothetical protein